MQEGSNTGSKAQAGWSEEESEAKQQLTAAAKGHIELPRTTGGISNLTEGWEKSPRAPQAAAQLARLAGLCVPGALLMPPAEPGCPAPVRAALGLHRWAAEGFQPFWGTLFPE